MLLKSKSVFRSLINGIRHDWVYWNQPNWRSRIFKFVIQTTRIIQRPYYFLKWYEISNTLFQNKRYLKNGTHVFYSWKLRDPLHFNAMIRESVGRIHRRSDCPKDDGVYRDRTFKRKIWSNKFKYVGTTWECYACLFEPVERAYATGGEEGGFYFGSNSSWSKNERRAENV